jgi:hypothetical protein
MDITYLSHPDKPVPATFHFVGSFDELYFEQTIQSVYQNTIMYGVRAVFIRCEDWIKANPKSYITAITTLGIDVHCSGKSKDSA